MITCLLPKIIPRSRQNVAILARSTAAPTPELITERGSVCGGVPVLSSKLCSLAAHAVHPRGNSPELFSERKPQHSPLEEGGPARGHLGPAPSRFATPSTPIRHFAFPRYTVPRPRSVLAS